MKKNRKAKVFYSLLNKDGNKVNIDCYLTMVRRPRAAPAAHPHAYVAPL